MKRHVSVLVIDDSDEKYSAIENQIRDQLKNSHILSFTHAGSYNEGITNLNEGSFDIVILDLMIPLAKETDPSAEFCHAIVNRICSGEFPTSPHIIGLTEFEERKKLDGHIFREKMIHLELFDHQDRQWASKIANKIKTLSYSFGSNSLMSPGIFRTDIVILVAKFDSEFVPIDKAIKWKGVPIDHHPMFPDISLRIGMVDFGPDETRRVVLARTKEMGIASAAAVSTQLALVFRPRIFAMLGMCCGFPKGISPSKLGDIIMVENCACWDEGKYDAEYIESGERFKFRPRPILASDGIREAARDFQSERGAEVSKKVSRSASHKALLKEAVEGDEVGAMPAIRFGKLLSGLSVVSDIDVIDKVLSRAPDSIALEMEVYGVYAALANLRRLNIEFIAMKGVADFGFKKDDSSYDFAQPLSSKNAYLVFHAFMSEYFQRDLP